MSKKLLFAILIILLAGAACYFLARNFSVFEKKQKSEAVAQTEGSLKKIKEKNKIIIGTSGLFEPMSFRDQYNNLVGFDVDLAKEIAKKIGVEAELRTMAFADLFGAVEREEIDLAIDSITITLERSKKVLFSGIYLTTGQSIIVRKDNDEISGEKDLTGRKIGVQRGTTGEEEALKYVEREKVIPYDNREEISALKKGEIDAIITDYLNAVMEIKKDPNLKIVGGMLSEEYYGVMTKKGNDSLISEVNKIIMDMRTSGEMKDLEKKWGIAFQ